MINDKPKYLQYIEDVENNNIITNDLIKLSVKRFREFQTRDDIYFDEEKVNDVINFSQKIKHYLGRHKGKPFNLEPWQCFIVAQVFGWYDSDTNNRLTHNAFILIARKNGKSAFAAMLNLYLLIADGEASPELVFAANSREQAKILLDITSQFSKSLDPKGKHLTVFRNEIKFKFNNGIIKCVAADAAKLDGLNLHSYCIDEAHEAKNNKMWSVLSSSQGMRQNPMGITISTAGFNLFSPCYEQYLTSIEILNGNKTDDSFQPFIFNLDEDDNWEDENVWVKANPNLNITVSNKFIQGEILKAKNNPSDEVPVKTKTLNIWCNSFETWITNEKIISNSLQLNIEDFRGCEAFAGVDLSKNFDLTAISFMVKKDDKYYFFNKYFLPQSALTSHPQKELYKKWHFEKQIILTTGEVTNYNSITAELNKFNEVCPVKCIYYDSYNAAQWVTDVSNLGYNLEVFSQSLANFNRPTKNFERLFFENKIVLDSNDITKWCFNNVAMEYDSKENCKPDKISDKQKIDGVIAILNALGGQMSRPAEQEFKIYSM